MHGNLLGLGWETLGRSSLIVLLGRVPKRTPHFIQTPPTPIPEIIHELVGNVSNRAGIRGLIISLSHVILLVETYFISWWDRCYGRYVRVDPYAKL